jgi:tetratricopeptide (TPR) repeat protein
LHVTLRWFLLAVTLTCAPPEAFPAPPAGRAEALAALADASAEQRAGALAWLADHGAMADQPLLIGGLRDADPFVRRVAEQALWLLWSRSGDDVIDRLLVAGIEQMQAARFDEAIATFSEVIRRKPTFAEGWNKRATARYLAGDFERSLRDCDEVLKRNPQHFGALSGYGQIYFQLEQLEKALAYWRRALEVNPNMPGVEQNVEAVEELLREKKGRST